MSRIPDAENAKRLELYKFGMSDRDIAERVGSTRVAIFVWRRRRGLPAHKNRSRISRREQAERMSLYKMGWSDHRIARARGTKKNAIFCWRRRNGLTAHFGPYNREKDVILSERDEERRMMLYRRGLNDCDIAREIGRSSNAVWAWRMRRGLPKNEMQRDWDRPATSFVSLDADLSEGGFNLHGLIADDAAAKWLEENGATTW